MDVLDWSYLAFVIICVYFVNRYSHKNGFKEKTTLILTYFTLAVSILACFLFESYNAKYYGNQIGSLFEQGEYEATYYVNLFENENRAKNYRVVAEIYRTEGKYTLISVQWPNGGELTFYDTGWDYPVKPYEKIEVKDDNGETWFVELTKDRVQS